jgi:hypothetical protein
MKLFSALFMGALLLLQPVNALAQSVQSSGGLVIYQVQTGNATGAGYEYVSIFNNGDMPADVSNWCIQYVSASGSTQTPMGCFVPPTNTKLLLPSKTSATFASAELSNQAMFQPDVIIQSGMSATSGHIRLLDTSRQTVDTVGWGTATQPEGEAVAAHQTGKLLQRNWSSSGVLQDTQNNKTDFTNKDPVYELWDKIVEETLPEPPQLGPLLLTELYPDAPGTDAGSEYIELYNDTGEWLDLRNHYFALESGTKGKPLPEYRVPTEHHFALSDEMTGLTLPNTTATVYLKSPEGKTLASAQAYSNLDEGIAWALYDGGWHQTRKLTPGSDNIIDMSLQCPEGQALNVTTNECVPFTPDSLPITCKEGYELNPSTKRCRKIPASQPPKACDVGFVRNEETGRCKKLISELSPKPCPAGQERSLETGRCRKQKAATGSNGPPDVKDVTTPLVQSNLEWWLAGASGTGAAGYAAYEWRRDLLQKILIFKNKLGL